MIRNYLDYINLINEAYTGSNPTPKSIYWNNQLEDIMNNEWTQISITRFSSNLFEIKFRTGEEKFDYHSVLVEKGDKYLLEDNISEKFQEKLKTEFWKAPQDYYKNIKYAPKCLGDISHIADVEKYNM